MISITAENYVNLMEDYEPPYSNVRKRERLSLICLDKKFTQHYLRANIPQIVDKADGVNEPDQNSHRSLI